MQKRLGPGKPWKHALYSALITKWGYLRLFLLKVAVHVQHMISAESY